jgi:gas vesicle protein
MFKNFILRKLLDKQLKDVPEEQKEKIMKLIEEKPELFQMIAMKAQEKMKQGKSQMDAVMEVVKENESELKGIL